jgi:hypothetical protein
MDLIQVAAHENLWHVGSAFVANSRGDTGCANFNLFVIEPRRGLYPQARLLYIERYQNKLLSIEMPPSGTSIICAATFFYIKNRDLE